MKVMGILVGMVCIFPLLSPALPQTCIVALSLFSNGDLIDGRYWLQDKLSDTLPNGLVGLSRGSR